MGKDRQGKKERAGQKPNKKSDGLTAKQKDQQRVQKGRKNDSAPAPAPATAPFAVSFGALALRPKRGLKRTWKKRRSLREQWRRQEEKEERKEKKERMERGEEPWEGWRDFQRLRARTERAFAGEEEGGEFDVWGGEEEEEAAWGVESEVEDGEEWDTDEEDLRWAGGRGDRKPEDEGGAGGMGGGVGGGQIVSVV
ncbi:hypothetical protein EG329_010446 [Mollisiaceae sp. DMI_Dod_QoI]|nr:hypothetical protein EG329_010446 [Helotiales sp. DMI_Dod_QoI]